MKRDQLSERIGNIEDRLVDQAINTPNFKRQRRNQSIRRIASAAAVLTLMFGSFTIGAYAMSKEVVVYVDKEQEIIAVGDSGISVILPDNWAGKYGYELKDNGIEVYQAATREKMEGAGNLFWIDRLEGVYPMDYIYPEPGYTIAVTAEYTYRLKIASDIQFDINDTAAADEYAYLSQSIGDIQILMTDWMKNNSTNAENRKQGTVNVSYLESGAVIKTVALDEDQSKIIKNIIESQDYNLLQGSFYSDLLIMFDGAEYYMNSETGSIENAGGYPYSAVLSAGDLNIIIDLLSR